MKRIHFEGRLGDMDSNTRIIEVARATYSSITGKASCTCARFAHRQNCEHAESARTMCIVRGSITSEHVETRVEDVK